MGKATQKNSKKTYRRTFTYFIPAPPQRKSGYREIEFDKILNGIIEAGFEIEEIRTESVASGVYVFSVLKTDKKKVFEMDQGLDIQDMFKLSSTHSSPDIILEDDDA